METKTKSDGESNFGTYFAPDNDFERTLHWLYGDRYYLQGSHQDFIELFLPKDYKDGNIVKPDPAELIEIAKLALAKGELVIAEKALVETMRTVMLDSSYNERKPEPYLYLAEVLEKKSEDKKLDLPQKQRFLLQAAAMYNFVRNYLKTKDVEGELSKKLSDIVSSKLVHIEKNMIEMVGRSSVHCRFNSEVKRNQLKNLREEVKESLESLECRMSQGSLNKSDVRHILKDQMEEIKTLSDTVSVRMKQFFAEIINECLEVLGTPPCDYEVIVFGSLARNEMTPYSDFEWAILTGSEEEECKVFFRNLTNLVHLQILNLGETILPSMNIEAISGGWFYDDITPRGVSFDGFLPQACKTPLGNVQEFELIHTPEKMADFQNNDWYGRNRDLGDTLLTFSPLEPGKNVLVDAYREEMAKILSSPCDLECCEHDTSFSWPTRGSCRGITTLHQDLSRYGDVMTGNNDLDDGKFYDVKKEIYRLTDRVFAALAKCYEVDESGTFAILDELCRRDIISLGARDNFSIASAIAIKLRLNTYLTAEKQGEQLVASSHEEKGNLKSVYCIPNDEELFHFFFIAIPLYEELQQFKAAGNIPQSLANRSFFDNSDATMGHVYCRLLNYAEALKCYERALGQDPKKLSIEIRRIRISLFITRNTEVADKTRENLDILLSTINQSLLHDQSDHNQTKPEAISFVNLLDMEECRQLLEVLLFASMFYDCRKYFGFAEKILTQSLAAERNKRSARKELLMMKFAFMNFYNESRIVQQYQIDVVTSELIPLINEEGVSTKSIAWLNRLGEFLFSQGKYDEAYRCFQRALSMEHFLYGAKPNVNMMTSLYFLGVISMYLFMYMESKFYFELLLKQFDSYGGPTTSLMVKNTYLQLALLSCAMECPLEKTVCYLENGLEVTTGSRSDTESTLDCILHCQLATTWHVQGHLDQALKSSLDGKACLKDIFGTQARVTMTCLLATTLNKISKANEATVILKEEIQNLSSLSHMKEKSFCMMSLGKLCAEQGLAQDAENYYKQALDILVDMKDDKHILDILECFIGISGAIIMGGRISEAKIFLDQAFSSAKKLPASKKGISLLQEIGELSESIYDMNRALQCYNEALRSCKESHIAKKLPFMEFKLEVKLGEMASNAYANESINPQIDIPLALRLQAQRSHYDHAADILRQHVATGHVDSTTVTLMLSLALKFTLINLSDKIKLLLETLKISEIVYGTNTPHEMVTKILGQLSDSYWMIGDKQAATKYRELLLKMEMELHVSDPFHEHISHNLTSLSFCFLETPGSFDTVQRVYDFISFSQKDKTMESSTSKAAAARCFTSLCVLFYCIGDLEEAETSNEMASQIFSEIHESVKRENLSSKPTCDIMKKVLTNMRMTQNVLPSHKEELFHSIFEVFRADNDIELVDVDLIKKATVLRQYGGFEHIKERSPSMSRKVRHNEYAQKLHKEQSTLFEDLATSENCRSSLEKSNSYISSSVQSSDDINPDENDSSDPKPTASLAESLSRIRFPLSLKSFPDALVNPESIKSTNDYLDRKQEVIESKLPSLATLSDSLEYNLKIGNFQQAARIHALFESEILSLYENCPFDSGGNLISEAARRKKNDNADGAVKCLDRALQLPSNWRRKTKILKLRGECYLSMGNYRTAAINFYEAASFYSTDILENCDDLCEYLVVLICLVKSEMLCQKVEAAWLLCQEGIKLVSEHELTETMQAVELFYLGARCVAILSESAAREDDKLAQACSLCQQALALSQTIDQKRNAASELMEELGSSEHGKLFALKCEVQLLLAAVFQKLQKEEQARGILEEMKEFLINIAVVFESLPVTSITGGNAEFRKISRRLFSWIGRVLVMCNDIELSINWFSKSLLAFFSGTLPDILSFYEEFLPLLQAVTVTKSNPTHESHSPFQQAIDMCKEVSVKHGSDLNNVYTFLKTLAQVYMVLGRTEEAHVVAEAGLAICDLMWGTISTVRMDNRCRMLMYLAQIHQLNSTNPAFDRNKELHLAEKYYLADRDSTSDFALRKDLSYINFLFDQKRFAEAHAVLRDMNTLGEQVWKKLWFCSYFSRVFYGPGVQKSVEDHGELLAVIGEIMCATMVRVLVGMGKKKEAVVACECLTAKSVPQEIMGRRPSCIPYLIEACHRELLALVTDEDRMQLLNCDFPLSGANLAKLYYMLKEYTLALKYCKNAVESPDLIDMKISCFHLAGNELVEMNRGDESHLYFIPFLAMLQSKEGFLDKPFHVQCTTLRGYTFSNQYYVFRWLGKMQCKRGNLDGAIQCYERCLDLDEDFTCGQDLVATLAELYQSKALTVDIKNQDSYKRQMNLALKLFQKLLQKTDELTTFVECEFAELLSKLERNDEAVKRFENVLTREDETLISFGEEDKPLLDIYLRRELDARGKNITIPLKVRAFYQLILVYMKLNEVGKAQEVVIQFENEIVRFQFAPTYSLALAAVGYANKLIGNKKKAAEIFVSVLDIIPGHPPVSEALESCCM